jgi:hypothetical protein
MDMKKFLILALAALLCQPALAAIHIPCKAPGYKLVFFNGAWTTRRNAEDDLNALAAALPAQYNGHVISPELFYNHTGCDTQGATCLQDLAEVFIQRAQDIDSTGSIASHFELFWEAVGDGSASLTQKIVQIYSGAQSLFDYLHTRMISGMMAGLSYLLSHPPTISEDVVNDSRLYTLETEGEKLLLVGHSQGNLFLNQAYDYIVRGWGKQDVAAVQIAPASASLRGPYVLADIDLVINALRVQGGASVPPVNMSLPLSSSDWSGHSLVDTYLDPARSARTQVISLITSGLAELGLPNQPSFMNRASFTVALSWNKPDYGNLDVTDQNGVQLGYLSDDTFFGYMRGVNNRYGPLIFFATCDPIYFRTGIYHIAMLTFYAYKDEIATIQVATSDDGVIFTKSLSPGSLSSGYSAYPDYTPVFDIIVTNGASSGEYSISIQ